MPSKYRKKPVTIEAAQWAARDDAWALIEWADGSVDYAPDVAGPADPVSGDD